MLRQEHHLCCKGRVFLQSHPATAGQYIALLRHAGIYSVGVDERDADSSRHGMFDRHRNEDAGFILKTVHEQGASWYKHTMSFKYLIN